MKHPEPGELEQDTKLVTAVLAVMVIVLIMEALLQWYAILGSRRAPVLHESPYVPTQWAEGFSGVAQGDD